MSNITFVKGNAVDALINGEIDFLINQVNCQNKYASGIAKEIGEKIPTAKQAYHDYCEHHKVNKDKLLGGAIMHSNVIHIFGQQYYGRDGDRYTNYGALANGLAGVYDIMEQYTIWSEEWRPSDAIIGIPDMIGCGLGGADREIVLELIEHLLSWVKEVRIYSL